MEYNRNATRSYVSEKNEEVVILLSMRMSGEVAEAHVAKPNIIQYDNFCHKMLSFYTTPRVVPLKWRFGEVL